MNSIEIRKVTDGVGLGQLRSFLVTQPQFYPNHADWVDGKCLPRIQSGQAEGLLVIQDGTIVGDAVYQQFTKAKLELKNFRIDAAYQKRAIGHYLLRQVETEGAEFIGTQPDNLTVITDVSVRNFSGVEFFIRNGFSIVGVDELYVPGQAEYLLEKQPDGRHVC